MLANGDASAYATTRPGASRLQAPNPAHGLHPSEATSLNHERRSYQVVILNTEGQRVLETESDDQSRQRVATGNHYSNQKTENHATASPLKEWVAKRPRHPSSVAALQAIGTPKKIKPVLGMKSYDKYNSLLPKSGLSNYEAQ